MEWIIIAILVLIFGIITGYLISQFLTNRKLANAQNSAAITLQKAESEAENIQTTANNNAKYKAAEIIQNAQMNANLIKQEAELTSKSQRESANVLQNRAIEMEKGIVKLSDLLEKREMQIETREKELHDNEKQLDEKFQKTTLLEQEIRQQLYDLSKLTHEDAKTKLFEMIEEEISQEIDFFVRDKVNSAAHLVKRESQNVLISAMERYSGSVTTERNVAVVHIPSEDVKGKIIGREGRNIRTFEALAGVDLIIDDTPEAVVISCFDPIRREIAKQALNTLVLDGRIHPTRIEEVLEITREEINHIIQEKGESTIAELGIGDAHPILINALGKLHYRTSFGQNILNHSIEVAQLTGAMASELGIDVKSAKRAGLFHDIGKAIDFEQEGSHVDLGIVLAEKGNENDIVINAIASHHGDVPAAYVISSLVAIADTLSAARTGARNESLEFFIQRIKQLETIATTIDGVDTAYAVQAGRELRVIVKPEEISDLDAFRIAKQIREQVENDMQYPGTVKITVIREMRALEIAK